MPRDLTLAGRVYQRVVRRLIPSFDRQDAAEAARVFDELRRDAEARSVRSWLAAWWREMRSMLATALDERRRLRAPSAGHPTPRRPRGWRAVPRTWLDDLISDLRYGARHLLRSPVFTVTATASVSLGIAVVVLVFSAVHGVLWKPLPVAEPEQLIRLSYGDTHGVWSYLDFADATSQSPALRSAAAFSSSPVVVTVPGSGPRRMLGDVVSRTFFDVAGVPLAAGRSFAQDDPDDVVVIGYRVWQQAFGGSLTALGQRVEVQGRPHLVIGIAPAGFPSLEAPVEPAVWYPISREQRDERGWRSLGVIGRLAPGASVEQAQAQLDAAARRLFEDNPKLHGDGRGNPVPIRASREMEGRIPAADRPAVLAGVSAAFGLAGLILALAASNVANLLLGRSAQRQPEIAVRLALGSGRLRVVRQLLAESFLLAAFSGAAAMVIVRVGLLALAGSFGQLGPAPIALGIDTPVLLFATVVVIGTGLLFGLAPALHASRFDLMAMIRRAGTDARRLGLRRVVVGVQVAGAVVLTIAALLFLRSVGHAARVDAGFSTTGIAVVTVDLEQRQYEPGRARAFFDEATARLAAVPGVSAVVWARMVPLSGNSLAVGEDDIEGYEPAAGGPVRIGVNMVTPGYFELLRIPLRAGRDFTAEDREGAPPVAIVNEAAAERFWPGQDPIGKRVGERRVVGITANIRVESLNDVNQPYMWQPLAQVPQSQLVAHVLTEGDPSIEAVRLARVVNAIDPALLVDGRSLADVTGAATLAQRLLTIVFGAAGLAAIGLAMMGVYGVMAYLVSLRTREMGVRIALGAAPLQLVRQTLLEGVRMTFGGGVVGIAVGIVVAFGSQALLVGVRPLDPLAFLGAVGLVLAAALVATFVPARRASRISPTVALRYD